MNILFIIFVLVGAVQSLKVIPVRGEVVTANPAYFRNVETNVRRSGRGTPYHVNLSGENVYEVGNNYTLLVQFYEVISGNYSPLPGQLENKVCDFFNYEQLLGKLIRKQLPKNFTCPTPPGYYPFNNLLFDMDLPFDVPFTTQGFETMVCLHFILQALTKGRMETYLHVKYHARVIQRPRNKN